MPPTTINFIYKNKKVLFETNSITKRKYFLITSLRFITLLRTRAFYLKLKMRFFICVTFFLCDTVRFLRWEVLFTVQTKRISYINFRRRYARHFSIILNESLFIIRL